MKDSALPVSSPPPASLRSIMKIQEQPPASATSPAPASEKQVTNSNATENGTNQEGRACSVLVLHQFLMISFTLCESRCWHCYV